MWGNLIAHINVIIFNIFVICNTFYYLETILYGGWLMWLLGIVYTMDHESMWYLKGR